jgi:hypothetical protein
MFAWQGGNDAPYDGKNTFGLVSGFEGTKPIPRPAWEEIVRFYRVLAER